MISAQEYSHLPLLPKSSSCFVTHMLNMWTWRYHWNVF